MNILEEIISHKHQSLQNQCLINIEIINNPVPKQEKYSLKNTLLQTTKPLIIAEFKRKSPSKGILNDQANVSDVVNAYYQNGASAISVLTDETYFKGHINDLKQVSHLPIPFLRKDFIIHESQIDEAAAAGASIILLIAACLTKQRLKELAIYAKLHKLETLLEVHTQAELDAMNDAIDIIGINNRNLKTFEVNLKTSQDIAPLVPKNIPCISESGIKTIHDIQALFENGCHGFLIGEQFMSQTAPAQGFINFMTELNTKFN
ncbi:MAG: indole-3-glycerol phosphate synthase TrpC [Alphaproteobacteria bacterium]|nr:indole-3-glycerol phosphate synthase TrpC [Alphaproteobacteria bacterium]